MSDGRPGGSRRWTLLLALLAVVVVAGAALRAGGIELRGDERPERRDDAPSISPAVDGPIEGDLVIEVAQVAAIDGQPADTVRTLGPVLLDSQATLSSATSRLGAPDSSGPYEGDPNLCAAAWGAYELRAWFRFGHPPSPEASCSRGTLVMAIARGGQWRVEPLGIAIGDDVALLEQALPGAAAQALPPAFAQLVDAQEAYVLAIGAYAGERTPVLYGTTDGERVEAFVFVSAAD